MKSAVLVSPGDIQIQQGKPLLPKAYEAIVGVTLAGVCGTDLALYGGSYPTPLPLVPGHEFVGRVLAVNRQSDAVLIGRRVTAEINNTCLSLHDPDPCRACMSGLESHCSRRTVTGIISHDGAFAEQMRVPVRNLHLVPDEITDAEAIFIEPLAAAIQTFEMAPLEKKSQVVVLGAGRLGYLIAGVARTYGADVLVVARSAEKCRRAQEWLGVTAHQLSDSDELISRVRDWTGGLGASHVVEATGFSHSSEPSQGTSPIDLAVQLVRPRGVIDLKSTPGNALPGIPVTKIAVDEIRLQGSRCGPFDKAISLISRHPFPIASLIDKEYTLDEAACALDCAPQSSKVVIRCAPSRD